MFMLSPSPQNVRSSCLPLPTTQRGTEGINPVLSAKGFHPSRRSQMPPTTMPKFLVLTPSCPAILHVAFSVEENPVVWSSIKLERVRVCPDKTVSARHARA